MEKSGRDGHQNPVGDHPRGDQRQPHPPERFERASACPPVGVIVGVDEAAVENDHDLLRYIALETDPDDTVDVAVVRDGERQTVAVTLGSRPP